MRVKFPVLIVAASLLAGTAGMQNAMAQVSEARVRVDGLV